MRVAVIGTGYVGLVSGAGFAELGHEVACADIDAARIASLQRGEVPFHERGLAELLARNAARLRFTTELADALRGAAAVVIAVRTPPADDGSADLTDVLDAARRLAPALDASAVVIVKSTVPPGTCARLRGVIAEHARVPFSVASNPELMKEGAAVADFLAPSRIIVGVDGDPHAEAVIRDLYREVQAELHVLDTRSAELAKYAANAMLATRISFMNELARLAEATGADIEAVRVAIGSDPRIGPSFLHAGAGFGGSCFPKDLRALLHTARSLDVPLGIVDAVARANDRQRRVLAAKLERHFGKLAGKRIALWGLAFKPDTDDIREAPALALIAQLREAGAHVVAYDPAAMPNTRALLGEAIELAPDPYAAAAGADALVLVTEWRELCAPDFARLAATMRTPVLVDGRNAWPRVDGFACYAIGR